MSDSYFEKMADLAMQDFDELDKAQLRRQIKLTLKEVARDVRHKAMDLANDAVHKIHNLELSN